MWSPVTMRRSSGGPQATFTTVLRVREGRGVEGDHKGGTDGWEGGRGVEECEVEGDHKGKGGM